MTMYRRLCQPLWSYKQSYKRRTFCMKLYNETLEDDNELLRKLGNKRKTIDLKYLIQTYPDVYNKIVKENPSSTDWQNIRENILQYPPVTDITVDSTILDMCLHELHVDQAMKYIQFLKEHDYPLNVAIIGKYLRLFVLKRKLTNADKREIVAICDSLLEKYPCLDAITAEHCIISLCLTDQWERSSEIINMMKLTSTPGVSVYSAVAKAAFQHNKPDIGWDAMQQIVSRGMLPQHISYMSYLQYCEHGDQKLFDDKLEKMFVFWENNGEKPYFHILNAYAKIANKHGWSAALTDISKEGQCRKCSNRLSDLTFSQETFQELASAFMKRVIVGSDIYKKSNPQELRKFTEFIAKTKPYDIIIDGLNTSYVRGTLKPQILLEVVQHFVQRRQKVLVLCRQHQKNLPIMKYIQQNALIFWVHNLSMDDPYLLYATLASGEKAMFVSSDLMRQHKHVLQNTHLQWVFKKWQCSHQYRINISNSKKIQVKIVLPFSFMPHSQMNLDSWHIPYIDNNSTNSEVHEFPDKWYCFHKKHNEDK